MGWLEDQALAQSLRADPRVFVYAAGFLCSFRLPEPERGKLME